MTEKNEPMDTMHFKKLLEKELARVETELKTVGRENPAEPGEYEATSKAADDADTPDENMLADSMDEYESNKILVGNLEIRLHELRSALERIKTNTYGYCSVCKKPIEAERLNANPAADTCEAHLPK